MNVTGPDNITRSEPTANPNACYIDGLYFSVVTFTTVGYGDMGPQTQGWRLFSCFFALAGIAVGGGCLGIVLEEVSKYRQRRNLFFAEQVDIDCNPHAKHFWLWLPCQEDLKKCSCRTDQFSGDYRDASSGVMDVTRPNELSMGCVARFFQGLRACKPRAIETRIFSGADGAMRCLQLAGCSTARWPRHAS